MARKVFPKQIRLTKQQDLMLRRLAKERGVSQSEIIRQALKRAMEEEADNSNTEAAARRQGRSLLSRSTL